MGIRNNRMDTVARIVDTTKLEQEEILKCFNHLDELNKVDLFKGMSSLIASFNLPRQTAGIVVLGWMGNIK